MQRRMLELEAVSQCLVFSESFLAPSVWFQQRGFSSLAPLGSCWTPLGWVCLVRPVGCALVTVTVTVTALAR